MNPIVSIIVPCYNQGQFLSDALNSVQEQTYYDWECIIIDDGSTDCTEEIATVYLNKDNRFRYYKQTNKGVSAARNIGISFSIGEFILPLDADDKIHSTYLEKAIQAFHRNPETKMVYSRAAFWGVENKEWHLLPYCYDDLLWVNSIFCSAVFRRADFDKTSGYNEDMNFGGEDWDFWISFLNRDDVVFQIDEVLFFYRKHGHSRDSNAEANYRELCRQVYLNHKEKYQSYENDLIYFKLQGDRKQEQIDKIINTKSYQLSQKIIKVLRCFNIKNR